MISPTQRPIPDNTRHSKETDIHAPGGVLTHQQGAADPRLRPRGHWDRRAIKNCVSSNRLTMNKILV